MNFSDINISTLILSKYTDKKNYHRDYSKLPRPFHSIAIMLNGTGTLVYENLVIRLVPRRCFLHPAGLHLFFFLGNRRNIFEYQLFFHALFF